MSTRRMMMASAQHVVDGVIQDSWEEIIENINKGYAEKYYSVGDVKEIVFDTIGLVEFELVGFNCMMKTLGSAAKTTWCSKTVYESQNTLTNLASSLSSDYAVISPNLKSCLGRIYSDDNRFRTVAGFFIPYYCDYTNHWELYMDNLFARVKKSAETGEDVAYSMGNGPSGTNFVYVIWPDGRVTTPHSQYAPNLWPVGFCL